MTTPRLSARRAWSLVALVAGVVIAPLAFVAHHTVLLATDTDRVAGVIEPLLDNPDIRDGLVGSLTQPLEDFLTTDDILQRIADQAGLGIEVPGFIDDAVAGLLQPLVDRTLDQVRTGVGQIVASEPFARSWRQMVSDTHMEMSELLTGDQPSPGADLGLSLRPFLQDIQNGLVDRGFDFMSGLPLPAVSITIMEPSTVASLRGFVQFALVVDPWGVAVAGVLLAAGIASSPRRQTAWAVAGGGVALGMVMIIVALWAFRTVWIPLQFPVATPIAQPIADGVFSYPITQAITIAVIAATVGAVGWVVESRISRQRAMS